jgi:glycosyltransferase involved in cell wall biosynthesis
MEEPDRMPARHTDALKRVHGIRKARVVFFYVGRFVPEKDPLICVEAMKILRQEGTLDGIVCAMAGYGPLRDRIQNTIDADELKDHVVLLPGTANIHEIVNMCSFGIVPSRSEGGIPYIVLEAASLGKPVIASTAGALTEFVRHNVNGVLVAPGEAQHLAEAIRLLANDRRLVGKLGAAARKDFQRHRGDKSADLILSVYRKVLAA